MKCVFKSIINGRVSAPPSKSMMQRAVAAGLLAVGTSTISNPSYCDDGLASIRAAQALGASVEKAGNNVVIESNGRENKLISEMIDCGESGLSIRMFTPIASVYCRQITLTGTGSMLERPVGMVEAPLKALGVQCNARNGKPPITVQGPLKGGKAVVDGSTSSQFVTGLLLALPACERDSKLNVENLASKQYVGMTLQAMHDFGVDVHNDDFKEFTIKGGQEYKPAKYLVEGDWSGASFILVAGAIAGSEGVEVKGLNLDSLQPDKAILEVLKRAGAKIIEHDNTLTVMPGELNAFAFDASNSPDLFPPLAALACACNGVSVIHGTERLKHKESDRAAALASELAKIGAGIRVQGNDMIIEGRKLSGGEVESHSDHRIAMACSVAGLICNNKVVVSGEQSINKSYPNFYEHLTVLGARVE